jgi:hypothetical protein
MKIDFSKIEIKDIEDNVIVVDISKDLGNDMYFNTQDVAESDLGHDIYHKKEIEVGKKEAEMIRPYIDKGFKAIVKRELLPFLDEIIAGDHA